MQYYSGQTVNICKLKKKKKDVIISVHIYSVLLIYNQKIKSVHHFWWTLYLKKKKKTHNDADGNFCPLQHCNRCSSSFSGARTAAVLRHLQRPKKKEEKIRKSLLPFDQEETTLQSKLCSSVVVGLSV